MKLSTKFSFACFIIVALIELIIAVRFLTASQIMDYHQVAMGISWEAFTPGMKAMTLNFMRAAGLGFLLTGITVLCILAVPFRRGEYWARWTLAGIILVQATVMVAIILNVRHLTPSNPPLPPFFLFAVLAILGFFLFQGKKTNMIQKRQGGKK